MLIIHPPLTKPCEPPAALAYLAAALAAHGHALHGLRHEYRGRWHISSAPRSPAGDTWPTAPSNISTKISPPCGTRTPTPISTATRRAVADINRVLEIAGKNFNLQLSLANYQDNGRSPVKSADLRQAAAEYRANIFFPYFSRRLDELVAEKQLHPHRFFPQLPQPGPMHLRHDRLSPGASSGQDHHPRRRPGHHLAQQPGMAQPFCGSGRSLYRRARRKTAAAPARDRATPRPAPSRSLPGSARESLSLARLHSALRRLVRLFLEEMQLLPGNRAKTIPISRWRRKPPSITCAT